MSNRKPRSRAPSLLALGTLLALHAAPACTPATPPVIGPKTPARKVDSGPAFTAPARWMAFPQSVGMPQARVLLDDGTCLVTTDDGQRWVVTPRDPKSPCIGRGVASGSPTYEALVGAQRVGADYRFVAEGGAVYTSQEPNGPFSRYVKSPTYLRRVAARGAAIVGLDDDGGTYFYDGEAWKRASVPKGMGGIDVAADEQGRVLWIGAPESMLVSTDAGRTFTAPSSAIPRIGAHEVGFTASGKLGARGVLGNLVWDGTSVTSSSESLAPVDVPDVEIEPLAGPRASLALEQRAAFDRSRYFELVEPSDTARHVLAKSTFGGPVEEVGLEELETCDNVKLAAANGLLAFACIKEAPDQPSLSAELYKSDDGGATLKLVTSLTTPSFSDMSFALAPDGTMLVLGACKPAAPKEEPAAPKEGDAAAAPKETPSTVEGASACTPKAPLYVHESGINTGTVPYLEEASARSPLLSPDGRTAYFIGRNRRDSQPAIFVSKDGAKTFQMRTIEGPQASSWVEDDSGGEMESGYVRPLYLTETSWLTMDETGSLGVVGERDLGLSWITLDADGRLANVGEPPEPSFMIGGVGSRVLALAYGSMDGILRTFESLDGGVSWAEVTTTPAVQRYGERGGAFVCGQGGCLLGDELARIGWEGQAETPFTMAEELFPDAPEPKLSIPIACQLTPKTEWTPIEGRPEERPSGSGYSAYGTSPNMPRVREVFRGKTMWSVLTIGEDGKVDVTTATLADKETAAPTLAKKSLLGAAKSPKSGSLVTTVRAQAEGYVALRGVAPYAKTGGFDTSKKLEGLELAWHNQLTGTFSKKTVALEAQWQSALISGAALRPSLLTVTMQGVTLQATASSKATYVDAQTTLTFDYPNLNALATDGRGAGRTDATFMNGRPFAVVVADRSPTAQVVFVAGANATAKVKGAKEGPPPPPSAVTVGTSGAPVDWIYSGEKVGFSTLLTSPDDTKQVSALGFMLEADGQLSAPLELPILASLADKPQPCSAEDRKSTPRVVSAHFGGFGSPRLDAGRRAVMVTDTQAATSTPFGTSGLDPIWLLTDGAVLHGTRKDPCLAGWRASGTRAGFVAVIGGNLEHAFLLRQLSGVRPHKSGGTRWQQYLEARPMTCRYQPDLAVPYDVTARAQQRMSDDQP
jgi:hypothetical protein